CEKYQKNYNREFSRQVNLLSSSIEDAFHIAYVFYRGIIEGTIDAFENSKKGYLSKEDFLSKTGGEMGFEKEQKEAIYWIANEYEKHLARHNGMTDNKFALKILTNEPQRIYDAIIVDEYQDLTELQILSLTNLLKPTLPHRILLFGDDNQAVNPTILNVSSVNSVIQYAYKKDKKRCELHINTLSSSYRSGPNLLSYINDVLLIKDKAIGKDKNENILARKTFREDEDDLYVTRLEDPSLFETLLLSAKDSDKDAVFIFPSATLRDEAKEKYASILEGYEKDNFLSVEESKGREWDSCVLVNFFSSSKEIYEGMLGEDRIGHKSTVHRMMFNRYYVALTRAENRVVVYEEDAGELSRKHFLSSLNELSSESDIKRIFVGELDPEHWIRVGDQLFAKGDYVGSSRAYRRGNKDERAKEKLERSELYRDAFSFSLNEIESIEGILRYRDYASLEDYYEERNLYERKKLFATLRNEKIEPDEKLEVFKSCYGDLLDIERKYAYNLIVRSYDKRIRKKLRFLNKKQ
ncbi:MAG: AAA family ATPase, partial [Bacilli bacterium]|nr:AAA family ATPase [Bacilli bacterium]